MQEWVSFDVLRREIVVELEYKNLSPLRIGSGSSKIPTSPVDLQVITILKNGMRVPYIPGSSLKGVLRTVCENIVASLKLFPKEYKCFMGEGCKKRYDNVLKQYLRENMLEEAKKLLQKYCLVCKVFGTTSYKAHLYVSDAYPIGDVSRGVKVGIAIDRRSGTARRGALYTIEYIEPGFVFQSGLIFKNLPNYLIGLVISALDMINSGFVAIGGFKTRGFGKVEVTFKNIRGITLQDNEYVDIGEAKELPPLDEDDSLVKTESVKSFVNGCREAWRRYVEKKRRGQG
ncbi:MAG: CRISPR-associated RAMP protein [Thermofilum sp. ex4484_82]|nr:CRISPR-associated RAMP protein Csx7 [Candidatus Baldrarchaeota archaeon]OYT28558.1 MAG: CRISPR-associated RAMP protein [Thermofilum sp. ex4484_82]OYT38630.1 MAG: CRISPR-associated RAMP protein [Archaeoglobales archaeon ex4484_92]